MNYALSYIDLEFGDGTYRFKLGLKQIAELQEKRGTDVTWPDGSTGRRPKPLGVIRQQMFLQEYDPLDLLEIIRLGLEGGAQGIVNETDVEVSPLKAKRLVEHHCTGDQRMPLDEQHILCTKVMGVCCAGREPTKEEREERDKPPPGPPPAEPEMGDSSTSPTPLGTEPPSEAP